MVSFQQIVIIGVGLIGGSLAASLKAKGFRGEIIGFDCSDENLEVALQRGLIDRKGEIFSEAIAQADLIVLAVPVGQMASNFSEILPALNPHSLIIDVGSTKTSVIKAAKTLLKAASGQFIPTHPIAGAEKNGAVAARADLFVNHRVVITPLDENKPAQIQAISDLWSFCGAEVCLMTPEQHDQFFAAVSHLPHLLSFGLVYDIASRPNGDAFFEYAAGGFRDFSRIAASSPEMWRDICLANRTAILKELADYEDTLALLKKSIEEKDGTSLKTIFEASRAARCYWAKQKQW